MKTQSPDTSPEMEAILIEGYRKMSAEQKLERVRQATHAAQQMALVGLKERFPEASPRELALRLASLWLDREQMIRAFNWDPEA